jgi:hypothetical protein
MSTQTYKAAAAVIIFIKFCNFNQQKISLSREYFFMMDKTLNKMIPYKILLSGRLHTSLHIALYERYVKSKAITALHIEIILGR